MPQVLTQRWLTVPALSMIIAAVVGYYSSQLSREREIAIVNGEMDAVELRLSIMERWIERTEGNRFTARDGENLARLMEERIHAHEEQPAHGVVSDRLSRLESRASVIEAEIRDLNQGR